MDRLTTSIPWLSQSGETDLQRGLSHSFVGARSRFRCKIEESWSNLVFKNLKIEGRFSQKIVPTVLICVHLCKSHLTDSVMVVLFFKGSMSQRGFKLKLNDQNSLKTSSYI